MQPLFSHCAAMSYRSKEEQKSSPVERIPHGHHVSTFRESRDGTTAFALVCCHLCPEGRTGFEFRLRHCPRPEHAATWNKPAVKWCLDAASGAAWHWRGMARRLRSVFCDCLKSACLACLEGWGLRRTKPAYLGTLELGSSWMEHAGARKHVAKWYEISML